MSNTSSSSSSGIGFCGLLAVLFIGLKLGHVINWSWWWVLCPLWIGFVAFIGILILFGLFVLLVKVLTSSPKQSKTRAGEPYAGKTLGL
jgi:hypothetical protein